ncbi:SPFH domain-containing protein [Neobittarella massiliensis]|uniref:SPFH domain-containing protein n=1 Tax=Neobittarella massiliensis (ex Bilen et al. 2018) TaxID=2041842 RepID=A0A8J6IM21_9FIRM|nr:SPFH domain-containing protein [Neobittarella massiliensis]MBC3517136.1 SPFH domain-containing protein [Neobittarella massiliensis]
MGIIKAAMNAIGGGLADQWLEVYEAYDMGDDTVMSPGVKVRQGDRRDQNYKGTADLISNGSIIQVNQNQFMLLVDGGKVVDYTAEPGYYKVDNSSAPSLFNGQFGEALKETFERVKFGGVSPLQQKVYFINLQEIKNIAFGTVNPINYFDNFYGAELFLRAHGFFSIKITDPLKFYAEAIPRNAAKVDITDIHKLYLSEFLTALQTSINQMSADGERISFVASKGQQLANYMSTVLDDDWNEKRGMIVESVGISSISYDEDSKKLINQRNQGAMLADASIREGYVQGAMARGMEAAGSNSAGAAAAFMGMGMGSQVGGGFVGAASASNQAQMQRQQPEPAAASGAEPTPSPVPTPTPAPAGWTCPACGEKDNGGKFCQNCGAAKPAPAEVWTCPACGQQENKGKFCSNCGAKRPEGPEPGTVCPDCGWQGEQPVKFCPECGKKLQ